MQKIRRILRFIILFSALFALVIIYFILHSPLKVNIQDFSAPGRKWDSPKKVEDYFIDRLRMTPEEAGDIRKNGDGRINLRLGENVTLQGLTGNLYYYGFIKKENALRYALENTPDTTPSSKAIKVGREGTIDLNAEYRISEDMNAWEIANVLLNRPSGHYSFDEYNYFFMP